METTVEHTTLVVSGKTYPLTVTRQRGLQEILVRGKPAAVESVTILESPLGKTRCYTLAGPEISPEERAENRKRILEISTKAMIDQGIW